MLNIAQAIAAPFVSARDAVSMARAWQSGRSAIGSRAEGTAIVMLVVSTLGIDPRVRQAAQTLALAGYEITIIWPDNASAAALPDWGPGIIFEPLPPKFARFASRYPGFLGVHMLAAALKHRPLAFHAHDLNTMLIALVAGRNTGAHVVCDHHEWFAESVRWSRVRNDYAPLLAHARAANRGLEQLAFDHASSQITVCQSIADEMAASYGRKRGPVHVIRNIPIGSRGPLRSYPDLRIVFDIQPHQTLILYQGGVGRTRGLEPVIEALGLAPTSVLAIRGPAIERFADCYRDIAARAGAADRLHLLPPVSSADVVAACNGADAGLYTVTALCKSFTHALPNKVFEYLGAGLPVLTANYPEVQRLLVDSGVGLGFDAADPQSIAQAMNAMAVPAARDVMRAKIPGVLTSIDPVAEWGKLVSVYASLPTVSKTGAA